jgi:hypothetical protein
MVSDTRRGQYSAGGSESVSNLFKDRLARASGNPAGTMPMVDADPLKPSALPTPESYEFFSSWGKKCDWKNEITIKS